MDECPALRVHWTVFTAPMSIMDRYLWTSPACRQQKFLKLNSINEGFVYLPRCTLESFQWNPIEGQRTTRTAQSEYDGRQY